MENDIVLTMRGICKSFPNVKALDHVDFTLRKGKIHALMGENGAGKSTLIKVLTGVYTMDEGENRFDGTDADHDPFSAGSAELRNQYSLPGNYPVPEPDGRRKYVYRPHAGKDRGLENHGEARRRAAGNLGIPARPRQQLGSCSLAVQQMVAIARAVDTDCKVLILDEPTSSLDDKEVAMLFKLMRDLKERGVGIIFVTHFLEQVYEVSDQITVLRNGELVGEYEVKDLPQVELVAKMMGKDLEELSVIKKQERTEEEKQEILYEAQGLSSSESKPFDFHIAKGEVNGFTGLLGSGRSESVRAIFGADTVTGGKVTMKGKVRENQETSDAMKTGSDICRKTASATALSRICPSGTISFLPFR